MLHNVTFPDRWHKGIKGSPSAQVHTEIKYFSFFLFGEGRVLGHIWMF